MSKERTPLSKRTRFEIFKRDKFTCQYCGHKPPGVILHVDHIVAVASGGTNDKINLITSCESCNLGKSSVPLNQVTQPIAAQIENEQEKRSQIEGYNKWLRSLKRKRESECRAISDHIITYMRKDCSTHVVCTVWMRSIKVFLDRLPSEFILYAIDIADAKIGFRDDSNTAFRYFCGVCWKEIKR